MVSFTLNDKTNITTAISQVVASLRLHSEIEAGRLIERRLAMAGDLAQVEREADSPFVTDVQQKRVEDEKRYMAEFDAVYPLIAARARAIIEART